MRYRISDGVYILSNIEFHFFPGEVHASVFISFYKLNKTKINTLYGVYKKMIYKVLQNRYN